MPDADAPAPRVRFVTNGHGEDHIAGKLIEALRTARVPACVDAWPMVGRGTEFARRDVPVRGPFNRLPSEGFGTLALSLFLRDLRAGWLRTHARQLRAAVAARGEVDLVVSVGDVVPLAAAVLMRAPFVFVGCAKSCYYDARRPYTALEVRLLRRAAAVFPRDAPTTAHLRRSGVPARFVGNPMMDDLEPTHEDLGVAPDTTVVGCLPGSRGDAEANAVQLLRVAARTAVVHGRASTRTDPPQFVFAVTTSFDLARAAAAAAIDTPSWRRVATAPPGGAVAMRLEGPAGARAHFVRGRLADVLHRSRVVIGLAGTANEQAVGLGKPLLTFATAGVQGAAFARMKARFFGESAQLVPPRPEAVAAELLSLLGDPLRQARMAAAGRARMGGPGASTAIARHIAAVLAVHA